MGILINLSLRTFYFQIAINLVVWTDENGQLESIVCLYKRNGPLIALNFWSSGLLDNKFAGI